MRSIATTFAVACSLLLPHDGWGQELDTQTQVQRWVDYYTQRAAQYEIVSSEGESVQLELRPAPLLTYTNPIRGRDQHGAVFAWTRDGRPQTLGSIWSIAHTNNPVVRRTAHEIHSLVSFPLAAGCPASGDPQATQSSDVAWTLGPIAEGIALPTERVGRPAKSQPLRLVQMRRIASDLSAESIDRKDGSVRPLRLMPTPLMRYQSQAAGVIGGGVFAYVMATDPELLIVVEAMGEPSDGVGSHWRILPARLTGIGLRLSHGEKELWSCDKIDYRSQAGPYRLQIGVSELPATRSSDEAEAEQG